jgi:hypothetical protein
MPTLPSHPSMLTPPLEANHCTDNLFHLGCEVIQSYGRQFNRETAVHLFYFWPRITRDILNKLHMRWTACRLEWYPRRQVWQRRPCSRRRAGAMFGVAGGGGGSGNRGGALAGHLRNPIYMKVPPCTVRLDVNCPIVSCPPST